MEGLLYHVIIIISLVPHLSFCQDEDVFHCSAKPGCQISQCDPIAPAWNQPGFSDSQKVGRNEFPITCKSKNTRSSNNGFLFNVLQGMQVNTLDIRNMKTEIKELEEIKKQNQNLEYELSTLRGSDQVTKQELEEIKKRNQNLEYELSTIRRSDRAINQECFSTCKAARSADGSNEVTNLCLPVIGPTDVRCDFETDGGDWLVILRRCDGSINFDRNWEDYVNGFGILKCELWFGLEKLHVLTSAKKYELRIDMGNFNGERRYAKYSKFVVGSYSEKYKLTTGVYSGNAGNSFASHDQKPFTTKDNHNDNSERNCAESWKGGWWFDDCYWCHLTGPYVKNEVVGRFSHGIKWSEWRKSIDEYYSLQFVEMKIRPVD